MQIMRKTAVLISLCSDIYKIIESASYSLQSNPDPNNVYNY
jgi:hypothetical protein